ncbi:hypothetical protein [Actinoplanes sp. NPDC048796]|uniref:hypothetical protein n=1 Tax=Actinoplanes sp. NPDC048796 TaxID=3155640 RepID=UPI0033EABA80
MSDAYDGGRLSGTWVPVERRWWGLDRRSLPSALVVAGVGILLGGLLPLIDRVVPNDDTVRAGDRLNLGDGLTIAPPAGWQLVSGLRVGAATTIPDQGSPVAEVADDGVVADIRTAAFAGDASALLDQVNKNLTRSSTRPQFTVTGGRASVTSIDGITGLVETYTSTAGEGLVAAYKLADGRGLTVEVDAAAGGQFAARADQVDAMLRSVSFKEPS